MSMISEIRSAKGREAEVRDQWLEVTEQAAQNRKSKIENFMSLSSQAKEISLTRSGWQLR
jgi:hypothetical protein